MNFAIECRGIVKRYPHFNLDHIDLAVEEGSIQGFVGPNGSGKSTTMRILMGLVHQDEGSVQILGHPMPGEQIRAKREIGFVSEDMGLYETRTIGFHFDLFKSIYPSWDPKYAEDLTKRFRLIPQQKAKRLSHGDRIKTLLLLALAHRPKLLILDEPTTGLDPIARQDILDQLMQVLEDETRTILFSSHNTLDVEQISDSITFLLDGRVLDSRDKESFLDGWRRIRLQVPDHSEIPDLPGVVEVNRSGRLATVTTRTFEESILEVLGTAGNTVESVDRMTLEEIFVATVRHDRRGAAQ